MFAAGLVVCFFSLTVGMWFGHPSMRVRNIWDKLCMWGFALGTALIFMSIVTFAWRLLP